MKTNAQRNTILRAVENVSNSMFGGNVVFRRMPEKLTKNVYRFTLRTKDATKAGSIVDNSGKKQPKANWPVHEAVVAEIFRLEPSTSVKSIYVDTTIKGRIEAPVVELHETPEEVTVTAEAQGKGKSSKKKNKEEKVAEPANPANNFFQALQYLMAHPEVMKNIPKS